MFGGKVIGGTSTINEMMYLRGNAKDYDDWEALGNSGWSYKDVVSHFIQSENMTDPKLASKYHGTNGLPTVSTVPYKTGIDRYYCCSQRNGSFKTCIKIVEQVIVEPI